VKPFATQSYLATYSIAQHFAFLFILQGERPFSTVLFESKKFESGAMSNAGFLVVQNE